MRGLLFAMAISVSAIASLPAEAQVMDRAGRALTPEEGRRLDAKIASLQRTTGLQAATIAGIARRLGLAYSGLSEPELFRRLDAQVQQAVGLRKRIEHLERLVSQLEDRTLRGSAVEAVNEAREAFEEGRFEDAERLFGELSILEEEDSLGALEGWVEANQALADLSVVQGEFNEATERRMRVAALIEQGERTRADLRWQLYIEASDNQRVAAMLSGESSGFANAERILKEQARSIVDPNRNLQQWAETETRLAMTMQERAERGYRGSQQLQTYEEVRRILETVIAQSGLRQGSEIWFEARLSLVRALDPQLQKNPEQRDVTLDVGAAINRSIDLLEQILEREEIADFPFIHASALNSRGLLMKTIARWCDRCDYGAFFLDAVAQFERAEDIEIVGFYRGVSAEFFKAIIQINKLDTRKSLVVWVGGAEALDRMDEVISEIVTVREEMSSDSHGDLWAFATMVLALAYEESMQFAAQVVDKRQRGLAALTYYREVVNGKKGEGDHFFVSYAQREIAMLEDRLADQ